MIKFIIFRRPVSLSLGFIAELRGRPAEPHTHMEKKRKPINEFSHGYHG